MDEWLPIETAKKENGRRILALTEDGICIATWYDYISPFREHKIGNGYWLAEKEDSPSVEPLYWMPLPLPIKLNKEK